MGKKNITNSCGYGNEYSKMFSCVAGTYNCDGRCESVRVTILSGEHERLDTILRFGTNVYSKRKTEYKMGKVNAPGNLQEHIMRIKWFERLWQMTPVE